VSQEQELRDRMDTLDVPPSRLDMESLLRDGRKRVTRRRTLRTVAGAVVAVAAMLVVPAVVVKQRAAGPVPGTVVPGRPSVGPTHTTTTCAIRTLPVPAGLKDVGVTAIDPTGRYIVGNGSVGQNFRPVLWTDGKARALPVIAKSVQLTGVNSAGVVVGLAEDGPQTEYAFRYQNGVYTQLKPPAGDWHIYPEPSINAAGDIVINVEPDGNTGGKDSFAIIWKNGATTATKLPLPAGANLNDITDDGTLIGSIYRNGAAQAGYAWTQPGKGRKLTVPPGQEAAAYAGRGDWATGGVWPDEKPALWNTRTGKVVVLDTPKGAVTAPALKGLGPGEAVNAQGWVVAGGYVVRDGDPVVLAAPEGQQAMATAIADNGLVAGALDGKNADGSYRTIGPRTWQC